MMRKFEYGIENRPWNNPMSEEDMAMMGREGWELVSVFHWGERQETIQYIWKKLVSIEY